MVTVVRGVSSSRGNVAIRCTVSPRYTNCEAGPLIAAIIEDYLKKQNEDIVMNTWVSSLNKGQYCVFYQFLILKYSVCWVYELLLYKKTKKYI